MFDGMSEMECEEKPEERVSCLFETWVADEGVLMSRKRASDEFCREERGNARWKWWWILGR